MTAALIHPLWKHYLSFRPHRYSIISYRSHKKIFVLRHEAEETPVNAELIEMVAIVESRKEEIVIIHYEHLNNS